MMKHKRHKKDQRDKSEKVPRHEDHRYYKAEYCSKRDYMTKDLSENCRDANEPKKLIIYIVNTFRYLTSTDDDGCATFRWFVSNFQHCRLFVIRLKFEFRGNFQPKKNKKIFLWSSTVKFFISLVLGTNWFEFTINAGSCHGATSRAEHSERESERDSLDGHDDRHQRIIISLDRDLADDRSQQ